MKQAIFEQHFVNNIAKKYEAACQACSDEVHHYGNSPYVVSKLLLNAYTRLLAERVADLPDGSKIYVNCVHPGAVDTDMLHKYREAITPAVLEEDMASGKLDKDALVTAKVGVDTPAWLALLPPGGPFGLFWYKRTVLSYFYWSWQSGHQQLLIAQLLWRWVFPSSNCKSSKSSNRDPV